MIIPINKVGTLEFEQNLLKYRMPLNSFNTDDISIIERNLKRKVRSIESDLYYLIPSQIEIIRGSVLFYYQLDNYKSFGYLRQLEFSEKLKYYLSLIEIAKKQVETIVNWSQYNFVVDPLEEKIKAIIFETDNMKISDNINEFQGIKDLILISLTKLENIYGKPTRTDFIDQDDHIIQFAETILKIDNLSDLDDFINTKYIEYEHGLSDTESPSSEQIKNNNVGKKNSILRKALNNKEKRNNKQNLIPDKGNTKKNNLNKMIFICGGLLVFAIIFNILMPSGEEKASVKEKTKIDQQKNYVVDDSQTKKDTSKTSTKKTDEKYNDELLAAYRLSLLGDSTNAVSILEKIGYNNLSQDDQNVLLNIYEKSNMFYKVMDLQPSRAQLIVNELIANNKEDELVKIKDLMKTKNPYVDFEVAYLKQNWKQVIELKDEVELNGRKEEQITDAYIALGKYKEGKVFAEKVGNPELLSRVKASSEN
ncbi:hypothetical protein MXL46_14045 [Heyndrickxia sporothermodurans]|uniref:hypothetical protein n=1 Tax=Heyndrickxia sporothermodurans TaxID=46224 RepID=UPI002DBC9F88|nr:hypothetical protein [Heyndrickxia sporothermodurans]MEB6550213.1 hypothetical protein [Heyndrickxia sporothermodurans]